MASSTGIMARLGQNINSIYGNNTDSPNALTRYLGGHTRENHPYINGYWQFILQPPEILYGQLAGVNISDVQKWFLSTCESFTPPSRNLNKVDIPGLGGVGASFVSGQTLNRTFTTTFREYKNLTMLKMINIWSGVIDNYTGVSEVDGKQWNANLYKGFGCAILTKPTSTNGKISADDIEEVFIFDGLWPESTPYDALNQDISSNDSVQLSVTWNFDGWPLTSADSSVVTKALSLLNNLNPDYQINYTKTLDSITSSSSFK